ncbi:Tripartite tricarboxylate transporter family receptor [Pigmentiphaga humi]|uniref:Tripartite tricarboxylate transporter family receptor n=1 Tax=Pigmentiphaga humi TaxID=2478468 RepID=A0A3P4AWY3_9BURK|nr:tripartite tricarboxylate transporter substrate binding protein [Pigmentiphaga humi]VCU68242.1 Tripartite tricarboxylate transporter family receptor [Pigmentiphaga humi]
MQRHFLRHAALVLSGMLCGLPAHADDAFPSQPVRIIVGSEAGSAPDVLARVLGKDLGTLLGQAVIVENRAGATGTIGAAAVAGAQPDGYTLLMGTVSNIALAPSFYPIKYKPTTSFTPISMVASVPLVLVASPATGIASIDQLRAKLKDPAAAASFSYSSPGVGGPQHLAGVLLGKEMHATMLHVPYKSGGAALTAVAGGETQIGFAGIAAAIGLVQAKRVTPLFVTAGTRFPQFPDVPSAPEAGLPGLEVDNWHALFAPAGLPAPVRAKLEAAVNKVLQSAEVRKQFESLGAMPAGGSGEQLAQKVAAETARWTQIVESSGIKSQ